MSFNRECLQPMPIPRKALDSVHHGALCDHLQFRGIPTRTVGLLTGLHSGTECSEVLGEDVSSLSR